jgi:hypothetical protein
MQVHNPMNITVTCTKPVLPQVDAVTIELTPREAWVLYRLFGNIGGGFEEPLNLADGVQPLSKDIRRLGGEIFSALYAAGFRINQQ